MENYLFTGARDRTVLSTGTLRLHPPVNRTVLRHSKISNGTVQVKKRVYGRKYGIFKYYKVKSEIYRVQDSAHDNLPNDAEQRHQYMPGPFLKLHRRSHEVYKLVRFALPSFKGKENKPNCENNKESPYLEITSPCQARLPRHQHPQIRVPQVH